MSTYSGFGPNDRVPASPVSADQALRSHLARLRELRPGLQMHGEDGHEPCDLVAQAEIGAGLRLVVVLEGAVDVSYGGTRVQLSPGRKGTVSAALVAVAKSERFTRRARRGVYSRRVSLGLDRDWLAQTGEDAATPELAHFMRHHLALHHWQPTPRAAAMAEQIVRPPPLTPLLQHIYLESRVLELVGEALGTLCLCAPVHPGTSALRPREHQRLRELHAFLASGQADALTLAQIARHAGVNANTLQRQFRAVYGTTVVEHLRECRLQRARQALERDGITVGQAALVAGYVSAANFATAYRRRFGLSPNQARTRI
ncbi:helix-turn-helix transcriptional regulator [Comamonas flocculans]|uniref:Helix-turn-helix domain-containing protein n=1 Tax=Comamonas flocculans TaxID=2597701 RepID=A0A5B8RWK0_9BURK|nr:AraC family transcriptional regulator [Comamonas flocculans]QEA13058.1 helix-turn-helix domain-containing protein [Comamonas flocculans]